MVIAAVHCLVYCLFYLLSPQHVNANGARNGAIILSRYGYASSSYYYGIVRVYYNIWGNICDHDFYSSTEANVICHQLGYIGASSYSRAGLVSYGTDTLSMKIYDLRCYSSSYLTIFQCAFNTYSYNGCANTSSYDATVYCYTTRIWNSNPYPGMIRLQGGNYSNEGRVEVYCNGQWGTICDNGFDHTDAKIICRQLGYNYYYNYDHLNLSGSYSQPIWSTNMSSSYYDACYGSSNSCPSNSVTSCTHSEDVTVECTSIISYYSNTATQTTCSGLFDRCPASTTRIPGPPGYSDLFLDLHWPETNLGDTAVLTCPCGGLDLNSTTLIATRRCEGTHENGVVWQEHPYDVNCNFSVITRRICNLADKSAEEKVEQLEVLTENTEAFKAAEVIATVTVLLTATEDVTGNITLTGNYFDVVDNLVTTSTDVLQESQSDAKATSNLLETVEILTEDLPLLEDDEPLVITQESFAVAVQEVKPDEFAIKGQIISLNLGNNSFGGQGLGNSTLDFSGNSSTSPPTVSLALPNNLFSAIANENYSQNATRLINSVFLSDSLFQRRNKRYKEVGSIIISARVLDVDRVTGLTNPPITLVFQKNPAIANGTNPLCSYWDETLDNGFGDWSFIGCSRNMTYNESQTVVICYCTHLTSFSILLDVSPKTPQERPIDKTLSAVTYIGAIISIICLFITIVSYLSHKKLRVTDHGQLLLNLCFALLGLYVVFIMAIHSTEVKVLCAIVASLLQYFFLVTFLVMAAEAINLYINLVIVLGGKIEHYVLKAATICWVLPIFIVIFCFAPDYKNYFSPLFCRAFHIPFYLGMIVPFLIIYIFNWTIFIIIFICLLRKSCYKKMKEVKEVYKKKSDNKTSMVKQQFLVAVTLSILFGLGWGLGLLATEKVYVSAIKDLFASLFVILTTPQGLLVFIVHCLRSRDIQRVWTSWFKFVTCKEITKLTASVNSKRKRKSGPTVSTSLANKESRQTFNKSSARSTSNAGEESSFALSHEDDKFGTLQCSVEETGILNECTTHECFQQSLTGKDLPSISEDKEVNQECSWSPILIENAGIIGSEEDSDKAELEYGVTRFELPDNVYDYLFNSASVGGMTVVLENSIECTVFQNPKELQEMNPFDHVPISTSQ